MKQQDNVWLGLWHTIICLNYSDLNVYN